MTDRITLNTCLPRMATAALIGWAMAQACVLIGAQVVFDAVRSAEVVPDAKTALALTAATSTGNAGQLERWADVTSEAPDAQRTALRLAVQNNPRSASAWMALGFLAERSGQPAAARESLERAFSVDRQYPPAWALANFCFRASDDACFWRAARRAAEVAAPDKALTDFVPLLRLADLRAASPSIALERLGGSARLERAYLDYLIGAKRLADASMIAGTMAGHRRPEDDARVDDFLNRAIEADTSGASMDASVDVWNRTGRFAPLSPSHGAALTNALLTSEPRNAGFDWRISSDASIASHWQPGEMRFVMKNDELKGIRERELLAQVLPVERGRYRLHFEYLASPRDARPTSSGNAFYWTAPGVEGAALEPSAHWRESTITFQAARRGYCRLALRYRRAPGSAGDGAEIRLRRFQWEVL